MATSKCLSCNGVKFEIKESEPAESTFKVMMVQCASCGGVVGTMGYFDAGVLSKSNQEELKIIKEKIERIEFNVSHLVAVQAETALADRIATSALKTNPLANMAPAARHDEQK
jgi:helix-turn-helix protein